MKFSLACMCLLIFHVCAFAQNRRIDLHTGWKFRQADKNNWYQAAVPGNLISDLKRNKQIPDPFFRDQEKQCHWADSTAWVYRNVFTADSQLIQFRHIDLVFDGIDTYASIYLNGKLILEADNMFRQWVIDIKPLLKQKSNELIVYFKPALIVVDSIAATKLPLVLPDHPRVYARKAQCQFGWDWGPKLVNAGLWKHVWLDAWNDVSVRERLQQKRDRKFNQLRHEVRLIQQPDSIGRSFHFEKNGKPFYAKGANWIPLNILLTEPKADDYRRMLVLAKRANMNMLRVWGGGIYEQDIFYELCDSLGIMVWQDFMFAGGMYPGDTDFLRNVKEEVRQQILRLRHHPSIVLWCGNNEIDEAWKNWGWQKQFGINREDSVRIYQNYLTLFRDSLAEWVKTFDGRRDYVHTSPLHGWGRAQSMTEGDSHYWGLWWGLQDWEVFQQKTGRFVSEFGMQAMPGIEATYSFSDKRDRYVLSDAIKWHQKANQGFEKLHHYLLRYMTDSQRLQSLTLEQYVYMTQCLQYYILKNSLSLQRKHYPRNMGSLIWQMNDCWPVTSWSLVDAAWQPKGGWYAAREVFGADEIPAPDHTYPKHVNLRKPSFSIQAIGKNQIMITCSEDARFVALQIKGNQVVFEENYFNLRKNENKLLRYFGSLSQNDIASIQVMSWFDVQPSPTHGQTP